MAVLRTPHRVLRPRLAPFGGWSLPFAPTRALRLVSHSARPPSASRLGGALPPLTRRAVGGSLRSPPFFFGFRFELRAPLRGVSLRCSCPQFAPSPRAPIARWRWSLFVGWRAVLRDPFLRPRASRSDAGSPLPYDGGCLPPSRSPRVFFMILFWLRQLSPQSATSHLEPVPFAWSRSARPCGQPSSHHKKKGSKAPFSKYYKISTKESLFSGARRVFCTVATPPFS